ncbi:DUF2267 domain-containing protein [Qaidamihabitans albus]|uniref:DUF2267 domain-containing protein n=1 Tax=Qaidamihabitans albus TaxID=2795733 RepID=UPI0027DBFF17|nr:DUF2267 domain-containing protein [Qaidamihabitans albus]
MIKHQDLVDSVREYAELDSTEQARGATAAVLSTIGHCLRPEDRRRLAEDLPGTVEEAARVPGQLEARDADELLVEVAHRLDTTPERARYLAKAVFAGVRDNDPDLVDFLRSRMASDLLDVLAADGDPPHRAESVRPGEPTELSDEDVERALRGLTGWSGDHTGISRTVRLPDDRVSPLIDRVQREAREMNDHAHTERFEDGVTFTLRTDRRGAVTEPDIRLAERIDAAVQDIGSGGRPG